MVNIAIVDDHDLFRQGLILVLGQVDEFNVIGDFRSGDDFLGALESLPVDVVLMDINMSGTNGIEATRLALKIKPLLKVIALTMFIEDSYYLQMIDAGARGFILKKAGKYELIQAIQEVNKGGSFFSQEILQRMAYNSINKDTDDPEQLSKRELEVLQLVCRGLSTKEISEDLFISHKTVEVHRSNLLRKANLKNVAQLIIWAIKRDYFSV